MTNLVALNPVSPLAADLPAKLRALADRAERGEITSLVAAWSSGEYEFMFPSSLRDSLVLATLLHRVTVDKFVGGA